MLRKKASSNNSYKKVMRETQLELPSFEKKISRVLHQPTVQSLLTALAHSFFHTTGLLFGAAASLLVGLISLGIAVTFNYQIVSFHFLSYVFVIGFVVGLIYQYLKKLGKGKD